MDDTLENEQIKLVRSKNKATHFKHNYVDVKVRKRNGKCRGAPVLEDADRAIAEPTPEPPTYNVIIGDIWFHIADHICPEEVQTFALICRETAALVKTRNFWRNLYRSYCRPAKPSRFKHELPANLKMQELRTNVISALFRFHAPLVARDYPLEKLNGRNYTSSWHHRQQCVSILCYKFWNQLNTSENVSDERTAVAATEIIDDWELLATNDCVESDATCGKYINPYEGVSLLVIFCPRFIPFPTHLLYGSGSSAPLVRLLAARQMLSQDMRNSTLELDFVDVISKAVTTVKYPKILKFKVLPWWHQDFKVFIKYESSGDI